MVRGMTLVSWRHVQVLSLTLTLSMFLGKSLEICKLSCPICQVRINHRTYLIGGLYESIETMHYKMQSNSTRPQIFMVIIITLLKQLSSVAIVTNYHLTQHRCIIFYSSEV